MTTPTTAASVQGNSDAPIASAGKGFGATEIAHYLVILAGVLGTTTGHTFGLDKHAQDLAPILILLPTLSLGLYRGLKHNGATKANAAVYMAQLEHVAYVAVQAPGAGMTKLALGLQALNGSVQADFPARVAWQQQSMPMGPDVGLETIQPIPGTTLPTLVSNDIPTPSGAPAVKTFDVAEMTTTSGPPDVPVA